MPLIQVILILAIVGLLLWAITSIVPMDERIRKIIYVVAIVAVCLWLLNLIFGFGGNIQDIRVGHPPR